MPELHSFETNITDHITRRDIMKAGLILGTTYRFPWLAEMAGEAYDALASPEDIIQQPIIALEPRANDAPAASPQSHGEPTPIRHTYENKNGSQLLQLNSRIGLRAEHTGTAVQHDAFQPAGVAVITTAEGLVDGKQEYCTLFRGTQSSQTLALGYEGGLFVFEPLLGSDQSKSAGEWVRVMAQTAEDEPLSPAVTTWVDEKTPHDMLIEKVVEGTHTLHDLGYRPWAATLPTTKMPGMVQKKLTPETRARDADDAANRSTEGQFFFVSERGDIVDLVHMRAKAGETFDLFTQLYYLHLTGEKQPTASVRYSTGNDARFEFSVDPKSLQTQELTDATFAIMTATSMLMEGVSQRYMAEKIPLGNTLRDMGGLSAEDPFSNSLGIVGMLSLIREQGVAEKLEQALKTIHRNNKNVPAADMYEQLEEVFSNIKRTLAHHVVVQTAHSLGVRNQSTPITYELPRDLYPLIATKVTRQDAATPTRINLRAAGIQPDNPRIKFHPVRVPAMQPTVQRILQEVGM